MLHRKNIFIINVRKNSVYSKPMFQKECSDFFALRLSLLNTSVVRDFKGFNKFIRLLGEVLRLQVTVLFNSRSEVIMRNGTAVSSPICFGTLTFGTISP